MKFGNPEAKRIMGVNNKIVNNRPIIEPREPGFYHASCGGLNFTLMAKDFDEAMVKSIKILHAHGIEWHDQF